MSVLAPLDRADLLRWTHAAFGGSEELVRDTLKEALRATAELLQVAEEQEARAAELEGKLASLRAGLSDLHNRALP